jgi:hypothetical protein
LLQPPSIWGPAALPVGGELRAKSDHPAICLFGAASAISVMVHQRGSHGRVEEIDDAQKKLRIEFRIHSPLFSSQRCAARMVCFFRAPGIALSLFSVPRNEGDGAHPISGLPEIGT